jgi:hypothetical protein
VSPDDENALVELARPLPQGVRAMVLHSTASFRLLWLVCMFQTSCDCHEGGDIHAVQAIQAVMTGSRLCSISGSVMTHLIKRFLLWVPLWWVVKVVSSCRLQATELRLARIKLRNITCLVAADKHCGCIPHPLVHECWSRAQHSYAAVALLDMPCHRHAWRTVMQLLAQTEAARWLKKRQAVANQGAT